MFVACVSLIIIFIFIYFIAELKFIDFIIVNVGCGQKTNRQVSYFQNPSWPEASQGRIVCTMTIDLQEGVEQVRLDMALFEVKSYFILE